jgi:subtilisin family serine protease
MMKLKVTANKLNLRSSPAIPENNENYSGYVLKDTIVFAEKATRGELYRGTDIWYKDQYNRYFWGGGVEQEVFLPNNVSETIPAISFPAVRINWKDNFIGLTDELKNFSGKGIKVAVIDTGVDIHHPDISANIIAPKDFTSDSANPFMDNDGHGTAIAGIICSNSGNPNGLQGVATQCSLIPIKVLKDAHDSNNLTANVIAGIEYAISLNADIINISLDLTDDVTQELRDKINKASFNGAILIASAGDVDELTQLGVSYPGKDSHIISIGASNSFFTPSIIKTKPADLNFLGGFKDFWTLSNKAEKYRTVHGSSFCAAFLSGLSALILSKRRSNTPSRSLNKEEMLREMDRCVQKNDNDLYRENFFSFIKI